MRFFTLWTEVYSHVTKNLNSIAAVPNYKTAAQKPDDVYTKLEQLIDTQKVLVKIGRV